MSERPPHQLLSEIASQGLEKPSTARLVELAEECERCAAASGDARYVVLEHVFRLVVEAWEEDGALSVAVLDGINEALLAGLPVVLAATSASDGYRKAKTLARNILEPRTA
ncbi:MAG: hypothetical protein ABSG64_02920 [Solirubrobacteraceae bacterium]|jgi:hypothetical protein